MHVVHRTEVHRGWLVRWQIRDGASQDQSCLNDGTRPAGLIPAAGMLQQLRQRSQGGECFFVVLVQQGERCTIRLDLTDREKESQSNKNEQPPVTSIHTDRLMTAATYTMALNANLPLCFRQFPKHKIW